MTEFNTDNILPVATLRVEIVSFEDEYVSNFLIELDDEENLSAETISAMIDGLKLAKYRMEKLYESI